VRGSRFAVPKTIVQDDLSQAVASAFSSALSRLSAAGATLVDVPMCEFSQAASVSPRGALIAAEAFWRHRDWLKSGADKYDPRVRSRIVAGEAITAANYIDMLQLRKRFVSTLDAAARGYDAMLIPTVADIAPTIAEVTRDDDS